MKLTLLSILLLVGCVSCASEVVPLEPLTHQGIKRKARRHGHTNYIIGYEPQDKGEPWFGIETCLEVPFFGWRGGLDNGGAHRLIILVVAPGSPADEAGLQEGDWLVLVNYRHIESLADLMEVRKDLSMRGKVKIWVIRDGDRERLTVEFTEEP